MYQDDKSKMKEGLLHSEELGSHEELVRQPKRPKFIKAVVILGLFLICWHFMVNATRKRHIEDAKDRPQDIEIEQIVPSENLEWHPCRNGLFCARLTVPMDYNRPLNASEDNPKVHIALLLAPGKRSDPKNFSISPLLINPGGPGGSGVMFAAYAAGALQTIAGLDRDVIGFDPRGISATTPRADCLSPPYKNVKGRSPYDFGAVDALEGFWQRMVWQAFGREVGLVNSTSASLSKLDSRARLYGKLCEEKDSFQAENSIFRHLGTPNVARDMISIIDAWDKWRDSEVKHSVPQEKRHLKINEREYHSDTKGKLVYWGFSYGTLLGATFAAIFPDRVGRVILDGVVDADQYVAPVWSDSIVDADKIFESFPKYCFEGKSNCPLYKENDTLEELESRFYEVQTNLKEAPFSFINTYNHAALTVTYDDVKSVAFSALYDPNHMGFVVLATILDAIVRGDVGTLSQYFSVLPKEAFLNTWPEWLYPSDAQTGILCGDKRYPLNETLQELQHRFDKMTKLSVFSDVWLSLMMGCDGWNIAQIDPPLKWGKHPSHAEKPINTSFPLLFLSNSFDPVTPLRAGVKMALKFENAGLVEQKSMGHCSLSAVSFCTFKKIRDYFVDGKVPKPPVPGKDERTGDWERCEANESPFKGIHGTTLVATDLEDGKFVDAARQLQRMLMRVHKGTMGRHSATINLHPTWDGSMNYMQ